MFSNIKNYSYINERSLRTISSWAESREVFNEEATILRAKFDANKDFAPGEILLKLIKYF